MKRNFILSVFALLIVFNSCRKDSSNPVSSIVGKWHWVEQTYDSYNNNQLTDHEDYTTTLDAQSYFEFDADGTFIENPQDRNGQFKYGKYQVKGDSLFFDDGGVSYRWQVKTLTSSSLIIHETTGEAPYRGEVTYSMKR